MRELLLRRHGESISPTYAATGGGPSWAGGSTGQERPDGQVSGIVKRFKKDEEASTNVTALGLIKASYSDAIEYTGIATNVRGLLIFFGVVGSGGSVFFGQLFLRSFIEDGLESTFEHVFTLVACAFIIFGLFFLLTAIRAEFFRPEDEPIIFDRKHRKVYRLFREVHPGVKGLFKRWSIHASEYDWDLIDAEHNAVLTTTGASVMRYHSLMFIVRKSATDPTIIDSFPVGNTMQLGELSVATVWEHIRRFMESNGPHLPPGESLNVDKPPRTLWESLSQVGPVGPNYAATWKSWPLVMVFYHLLFPFFVPLFFLWGVFNWLSYKTARPVAWPKEVVNAVHQ